LQSIENDKALKEGSQVKYRYAVKRKALIDDLEAELDDDLDEDDDGFGMALNLPFFDVLTTSLLYRFEKL
jgi:hypothetical protein